MSVDDQRVKWLNAFDSGQYFVASKNALGEGEES